MDKMERRIRLVLFGCALTAGIGLGARGFEIIKKNHFQRGKEILARAYEQAGELSAAVLSPLLAFDGEEVSGDWTEELLDALREQIPLLTAGETQTAERIIEDEKTSAAILEENERRLMEESARENQEEAVKHENEQASSGNGDGTEQEEEKKEDADTEVQTTGPQEGAPEEGEESQGDAGEKTLQTIAPVAQVKQQEIPLESLADYNSLLNRFFVVDPNTTALPSQINAELLMEKDMTMAAEPENPQILIYHTHSQEGFADSAEGDVSTTVIGIGDYLEQLLTEQYGYQVLHIEDTFDMADGRLERSKAYNYAEPVISKALEEHPSIQVVIDLHRDGVDEAKHLVTEVNGKPTAQIMFFNGLSRTNQNGEIASLPNPYIEENLAFSFQLEYLAKQYYPGYTRCIYLKGYRYNLHVRPRSLLLEVGAQTNTVEEAKNAMEPFADLLHKVLSGSG